MIRDTLRFLYGNLRHYSLAFWGIDCRLDPDYPPVTRFFPSLIYDTVYEYRTYGAMPLVSLLIIGIASVNESAAWALILCWAILSFKRTAAFRSNFAYWEQALKESHSKDRVRAYFVEWCIRETEQAWKRGDRERALFLEKEAWRVQDVICGKPFEIPTGESL